MRTISVIKYCFTALGFAMLGGALLLSLNTYNFTQDSISTKGTVVDHVSMKLRDSSVVLPVVEFTLLNGTSMQFTPALGSHQKSYAKGAVVDVLYKESAPEYASISDLFSLWGLQIILGGTGLIFSIAGLSIVSAYSSQKYQLGNVRRKKVACP